MLEVRNKDVFKERNLFHATSLFLNSLKYQGVWKETSGMKWVRLFKHVSLSATANQLHQNFVLFLSAPTPQNDQTHSNNSSAIADELFECV